MRALELLAPAKNLTCGLAAIDHGADAVYIGAPRFGARMAAGNSVEDIAGLCRYAHRFGAKVYATVNTLLRGDEVDEAFALMDDLRRVGVDAFLIQDMRLLRPGFMIHASTQTDNRTAEKVAWLREQGIGRVVLARELSVEEISEIHRQVPDVELEAFVHGALCVSYSGQCYASEHCFGRSANRGECAQFCRMRFDLLDADGRELIHQRHLLSLRDMCRIDHLEELAEAGVVSFKIEGRLKDVDYVKNVVSAYSQRLNMLVLKYPKKYVRSSAGVVEYHFQPDVRKSFNRGFVTYFLHGRQSGMASFDTPKSTGEHVGKVKEVRDSSLTVSGMASFANGDGLCYFDARRELAGFRVNRVEGNRLYPFRMPHDLKAGTMLYRNEDAAFSRQLSGKTAERRIPLRFTLSVTADGFRLAASSPLGETAHDFETGHEKALKSQRENIVRQLSRLGDTVFCCAGVSFEDDADSYFIPSSLLAEARRRLMEKTRPAHTPSPTPNPSIPSKARPPVAFPRGGGGGEASSSLLMQCRYCLRHELGYCVRHGGRKPVWRDPLRLRLGDGRCFRLQFDCETCQMNVYAE
ncbi:MAG: U32 family peptidase [Prevotella sp.]|nr:U32 family peptidase [Prevotella sp.]